MISAMLSIGILILDVVMVMVARRAADKGLGHVMLSIGTSQKPFCTELTILYRIIDAPCTILYVGDLALMPWSLGLSIKIRRRNAPQSHNATHAAEMLWILSWSWVACPSIMNVSLWLLPTQSCHCMWIIATCIIRRAHHPFVSTTALFDLKKNVIRKSHFKWTPLHTSLRVGPFIPNFWFYDSIVRRLFPNTGTAAHFVPC